MEMSSSNGTLQQRRRNSREDNKTPETTTRLQRQQKDSRDVSKSPEMNSPTKKNIVKTSEDVVKKK